MKKEVREQIELLVKMPLIEFHERENPYDNAEENTENEINQIMSMFDQELERKVGEIRENVNKIILKIKDLKGCGDIYLIAEKHIDLFKEIDSYINSLSPTSDNKTRG